VDAIRRESDDEVARRAAQRDEQKRLLAAAGEALVARALGVWTSAVRTIESEKTP
jgi:hypothetical protein